MKLVKVWKNRQFSNAVWIVGCKGVQMLIGLILSMVSARYLGPENYGLLSYAASITRFVEPLAQLGFTVTLVYELVQDPENEKTVLGTAMLTSFLSSIVCMGGIAIFIYIVHGQGKNELLICELYALLLLSQSIELVQYWFQAKLLSKYTAVITLGVYMIMAVYQIHLLITAKNILWFAAIKAAEHGLIAIGLLIVYRKIGNGRPRFSIVCAKKMIERSCYVMISNLLALIYAQTDRIMIRNMLGESAVGYYVAAVTCANATDFIFSAIIDSFRPVIMEAKREGSKFFEKNVCLLYLIVVVMAILQSILIVLLADPMITILYGVAYKSAIKPIKLIVWYTVFSYIGSARSIWILAEGRQRMWWKINFCGAAANICLNLLLIPRFGIEGAAFASLITQAFANVGTGALFRELRPNDRLLLQALNPKRWRSLFAKQI